MSNAKDGQVLRPSVLGVTQEPRQSGILFVKVPHHFCTTIYPGPSRSIKAALLSGSRQLCLGPKQWGGIYKAHVRAGSGVSGSGLREPGSFATGLHAFKHVQMRYGHLPGDLPTRG